MNEDYIKEVLACPKHLGKPSCHLESSCVNYIQITSQKQEKAHFSGRDKYFLHV